MSEAEEGGVGESFSLERYPVNFIGPSWQRGEDGEFVLPERSLGWEIAGWCLRYLRGPGGGPWRFTDEQFRLVLWWYALDEDGEFVHPQGVIQRLKGWGKDPLAAVLCLVELCGPARFGGWREDGSPIGVPVPEAWVEVYGVSRESTRNTMDMFPILMSKRFIRRYNVDAGIETIRANGGRGKIIAKGGSYRSAEGGRVTFMVLGETQHWVPSNGGQQLYDTVINNVSKTGSRFIAITNAYLPGQDSVAEKMRDAWQLVQDGRAEDVGQLYDSIEAHEKTPLTKRALRKVLPILRGDSVWLPIKAIIRRIMSADTSITQSRRMWLNQIRASDDALITPSEFDDRLTSDRLEEGDSVVLGFDGGNVADATALVAVRVSDGLTQCLLVEERPADVKPSEWQVDREKVDAVVRKVFELFDVQAFFADVRLWESHLADWSRDLGSGVLVEAPGRNAFSWDMRGGASRRVVQANELLVSALQNGRLPISRAGAMKDLRRHSLNARRRENVYGLSFSKETKDSPRKIDAWAAWVAAVAALDAVRQSGKKRRRGRTFGI